MSWKGIVLLVGLAAVMPATGCGSRGARSMSGGSDAAFTSSQTIAMPAGFQEPRAIAAAQMSGSVFVSAVDSNQNAVILQLPKTSGPSAVIATGSPLGTTGAGVLLTGPVALALSPDEGTLYVADFATVQADTAGAVLAID